jgi:hypothetical protein
MFTEFKKIPSGGANYTQCVAWFIRDIFNNIFNCVGHVASNDELINE